MIINIDSIEKIRKIVIEFDSNDQEPETQIINNVNKVKTKSFKTRKSR